MVRCTRCAHDNSAAHKFCGECGAPLVAPNAPADPGIDTTPSYTPAHLTRGALSHPFALEGERKRVTVMFCDIANSTPLAARVGAEAMHGLLSRFFELALAEVHRCEGTINQFLGDGFMALFGAPVAHEDHAQRALLAALSIQRLGRTITGAPGAEIQLRMGLNTGMVVVGKIGDNLRMDYTAVGDTTNLAARLQGSAAPGSIRVGAATREAAAAHFAFKDLGRHTLKGIAEPVAVFEPLADKRGGAAASGRHAPGADAPLVGRQQELATLSGALGRLSGGRGSLVLIRGEPGAGKTRLLAEAKARHAAPGVLWLDGRSVSFGRNSSYWPFIQVLRTALDIGEGDADAEPLRKLEAAAHTLFGSQSAEIVPYLATLLSIDLTAEHRERVRFLDAQAMKRQVFLSMRQLFERLAQRRPMLVVLEDWHWTDRSSVALLEHLLPLAASAPLSVFLTSRLEPVAALVQIREAAGAIADLHCEEIVLDPLADADSRALIESIMGSTELPEPVREQVQRRTAGNPFFIEEVMRAFIADGTLARDARQGRWRLVRPMADVTIPGTVQAVLVARIDRLEDGAKSVLKLASVIGRVFLLRVLKAVYTDADAIEPRLQRLEEAELIQRSSETPEVEYTFKHALVQEAAYDSILVQHRKGIHRNVAQAIATLLAERRGEFASLLAYHYARAEDWPMAQTHLLAAGDQAGRIAADAEALEHYRQAEATFMKVAAHALTPLQLVSMDRKLGQAFYGIGSYDEAVARFTRALSRLNIDYPRTRVGVRLAIGRHIAAHFMRRAFGRWMGQTLGIDVAQEASAVGESLAWMDYNVDEDRFALDGLIALSTGERSGDASSRIRGLATLGMVLLVLGWRRLAWARIAEAVSAADRTGDPAAHAGSLFVRGWFEWTHALLDEGTRSLERSAAVYRGIGDLRGWAGAASAQIWLLARRAQFAPSIAIAEEMVRVGESANDPHLASWGSVGLGHLCSIVGPLDRAAHHLDKVRDLSKRTSAMRMYANAGGVLAKCLLRQGHTAKARAVLTEALAVLDARGMNDMFYIEPITASVELCLVDAECSSGAPRAAALRAAASACAKALACSRVGAGGWRAETMRLHGTVAWLCDRPSVALQRWRESIAIADALALPVDRARALLEMGERTRNESMVAEARGVFENLGARVDLAFSLHALARLVAATDTDRALEAYALAQDRLDAVGAEHRCALARQERAEILARGGHRGAAQAD